MAEARRVMAQSPRHDRCDQTHIFSKHGSDCPSSSLKNPCCYTSVSLVAVKASRRTVWVHIQLLKTRDTHSCPDRAILRRCPSRGAELLLPPNRRSLSMASNDPDKSIKMADKSAVVVGNGVTSPASPSSTSLDEADKTLEAMGYTPVHITQP